MKSRKILINNLKTKKATQSTGIPTKLIKENSYIFGNYNNYVSYSIFPNSLKNAIITPVNKKGTKASEDNYRPVSISSNIYEIYAGLMFKQILEYFEPILPKFQCSFRKDFNVQHYLYTVLEKLKSIVGIKRNLGAHLSYLSKTFNCLSHDLLLAKLYTYGFNLPALRLVDKDKDKLRIQYVGINFVWGTSRINFGISFI